MKTIKFLGYTATISQSTYGNGSPRLQLYYNDHPLATATVCLPTYTPPKGYCLIKDYAENQGILDALVAAGVVEKTGEISISNSNSVHLCRIIAEIPE